MNIAELGLAVRSDGVVVASKRLLDMERAAGRTERATDALAKSLQRAMAIVGAVFSVQAFIDLTNVWTDLNSRVNIAAGSMDAGAVVMGRLSDMARRTYSSLELTGESFLLNATAMRDLGYSTQQTLDFVETLNNGLVVSGAKGDRAASVLNAISKAMALGKLSGDELNTVISVGGRVAEALAHSMGVTTLELRKLGAAGKITGKELFGITKELQTLRDEADAMPATIGDAFTLLGNSVLEAVGTFDQATQASSTVAQAIIFVADNIAMLVPVLTGAATATLTLFIPAIVSATGAFIAFTAAMLANPFVLAAIAIGAVTAALVQNGMASAEATHQATQFVEPIKNNAAALETAASASGAFRTNLKAQIEMQKIAATAALAEADAQLKAAKAKLLAQTQEHERNPWNLVNAWDLGGTKRDVSSKFDVSMALDKQLGIFEKQFNDISEMENRLGGATIAPIGTDDKAAAKAAKAYAKVIESANERIDQSRIEAQALGMTAQAADGLRFANELLADAQSGGAKISNDQVMQLNGIAQQMAAAAEQTRQLSVAYNFGKETFGGFFSDLKSDLMSGTSLWDGFANAGANALNKIGDKALSMAADGIWDMIFNAGLSLFGGGFGSLGNDIGKGAGSFANIGSFLKSANGNVLDGSAGLSAYSNRVVSTPTVFAYAKGAGLMGEAGPEAIMPLSRNSRGQLGVQIANNNQPAAANSNGPITLIVQVNGANGNDEIKAMARAGAQQAIQEYDRTMPDKVHAKINAVKRDSRAVNGRWG